jgi:hypothetical protein
MDRIFIIKAYCYVNNKRNYYYRLFINKNIKEVLNLIAFNNNSDLHIESYYILNNKDFVKYSEKLNDTFFLNTWSSKLFFEENNKKWIEITKNGKKMLNQKRKIWKNKKYLKEENSLIDTNENYFIQRI